MREREYSLHQFDLKSRLTEKVLGGFLIDFEYRYTNTP